MITRYEQRADAHARERDRYVRASVRISRLRLATFLPGAVLVVWSLARGVSVPPLAAGLVLLSGFAVLVFRHARIDERAAWHDALHVVNLHALARIGRQWDRLPLSDASVNAEALEQHPFVNDLDLFGRASLAQWLGPPATPSGAHVLTRWLLKGSAPSAVIARQQAVRELAPALDWREALAAHGRMAAGVRRAELESFLAWCSGPGAFGPVALALLTGVAPVLSIAIWLLIVLHAAGVTPVAFWMIPVVAGTILSFLTASSVHGEFSRAGAGEDAFSRYAHLFEHAVSAPRTTPLLRSIHARLAATGHAAPERMRQLNRILGFARLRSGAGIFHFVVQALTLWDFHVLFALDRWRRRVGPSVRDWMEALGELDALSAFARISADYPGWCFPDVVEHPADAEARFVASALGHPLIPDDRRVCNDVEVGPPGTLLLITGSNMSGKSTLLRAIGLNTVLAQAGAPACAASLRMPPIDLETSIRVQDSLEHGLSYFMAALARLKGVVDRARHPPEGCTVMYLLDELLQGTNTAERGIAVRGVARHLLESGAIGVMTTHDLALAGQEPLNTAARLVHFTETVDERGGMSFDYRLRPGLATSRNALRLMQLIGLDLAPAESRSKLQ